MTQKFILALALFCGGAFAKAAPKAATKSEQFKLIDAKTLSKWMTSKAPDLVIYDANNTDTRNQYGTIPGAKLLASYEYDANTELPMSNKASKLVFFCANTQCMASHKAAETAAKAGFKDVFVMSDGIMGWKESGFPTAQVAAK